MTPDDLEHEAQQAAEHRLRVCATVLFEDETDEDIVPSDAADQLAGPYCGCDTCVVREVVDAAWPWLYRLAHHPDTVPPALP